MVIHEKGLSDQVIEELCNAFQDTAILNKVNPLGKIPTLVLDNGETLFDSPVICQYLDSVTSTGRLIPENGPERWETLRWEALADGMTDAAYNTVMEKKRSENEQSEQWLNLWSGDIQRSLVYIDKNLPRLPEETTLAHLALGAAVGYLEFRLPEMLSSFECKQAESWFNEFKNRECMLATQPVDV